jgi:2-iminobutanoate/2-iminopropanoate deaminase
MRRIITTEKAPRAIGPYSQAVACRNAELVFTSGQIPLNPISMEIVSEDVTQQTRQVIENLKAVLSEAGCTVADVIKTTVFLKNMDDFASVNAEYAKTFGQNPPARSTVEVSRLPKNVKVEIEAIAMGSDRQ